MDLREALAELGRDDLTEAATEAWRRRHVNTEAGAAVLAALLDSGMTYRQIQAATGIPPATAHRWARPPEQD